MEKAKILAKLIDDKGYSRRAFAEKIGLPATTLQSMLTRGIGRASVDNVLKVCRGLGITADQLEKMMPSAHKIGWAIKEERAAQGMSAEELADRLGVENSTIIRYENDNAPISEIQAEQIAGILGMSLGTFLDKYHLYDEFIDAQGERSTIGTIAAHHDGGDWTEEELNEIEKFKAFVKSKRQNN